ncbi:MAG TPA: hypothetical protein PLZ85_06475 [Methylotenera sp.]|nr:hypothetical protein [Methylotenera sp.]
MKRYILHFDKAHPKDLAALHVEQFLSYLTVQDKASASPLDAMR